MAHLDISPCPRYSHSVRSALHISTHRGDLAFRLSTVTSAFWVSWGRGVHLGILAKMPPGMPLQRELLLYPRACGLEEAGRVQLSPHQLVLPASLLPDLPASEWW